MISAKLLDHSLPKPKAGVSAFARWVWTDPACWPGLRLTYDLYHELCANVRDLPKPGDIPDTAHIRAIPYVTAATLDRRMLGYVRQVNKKLVKMSRAVDYSDRLFANLQ